MKSTIAFALFQAALVQCSPRQSQEQQPFHLQSRPDLVRQSSASESHQASAVSATASPATWLSKYGAQKDLSYTGPLAFAHLPYHRCLEDPSVTYDVAILGMPFDTTVTFRPGARFGPHGIRLGSRRQSGERGFTLAWGRDPYEGITAVDCGDVSVPIMIAPLTA